MDSSPSAPSSVTTSSPGAFDVPQLARAFAEDGYVVLRNMVDRAELTKIQDRLNREFAQWQESTKSFRGGGLMSGHLNCYPGEAARGVVEQLRGKGVFELGHALLPTPPSSMRLGCNFNLPGSVAQHYHMDGIFLERFLVINVAVVDTVIANGAIDVVPRTHKRFYRYWEFAAGRVNRGSTRLPLAQGDVLIRVSTLWHRGMPNLTSTARPMLALTFGEKGVNTDDPFAYNQGQVEFQTNWFTTSLMGRIRERTTVMAPVTYSAYRFAHSLFSDKGYASF